MAPGMIGAPAEMVTPREFRRNLDLLPRPKLSGKTPPKLSGKKVAACVGLSPLGPGIVAVHPSSMPRCSRSQAAPGSASATARVPRHLRIQPDSRTTRSAPPGGGLRREAYLPSNPSTRTSARLAFLNSSTSIPIRDISRSPTSEMVNTPSLERMAPRCTSASAIATPVWVAVAPHAMSFDSPSRIRLRG
jgi:hypothetical protein